MPMGASVSAQPLSSPTSPASVNAQSRSEHGLLGQLPFDLILEIIARMVPPLREYQPVLKDDMEMMPRSVQPAKGPVAYLAAQLLGPTPPPVPVAHHEAWFAAGALAAGLPGLLGVLPMAADNVQVPAVVGGANAPDGALPPQVAEVARYTEATVLASAAFAYAHEMAVQQGIQAQVLLRLLQAQLQAQALSQAAVQPGQGQQPAASGNGQDVPPQEQGEAANDGEAGSEYDEPNHSDTDEQLEEGVGGEELAGADDMFEDADEVWGAAA